MLETRIPNNNKQYIEELNNEQLNLYLNLYETYSDLLYQYLIKKLEIKKYDDMVQNSKNQFTEVKKENKNLLKKHIKW